MTVSLASKRVLITGGSRGLGRELCRTFAACGARVAFSYHRDDDGAGETRAMSSQNGAPEPLAFKVSVLDYAATTAMVGQLEEAWGGIDVLINNAGVTQNLPFPLLDEADWDTVMDVNVKGTFLTTRAVLRGMMRAKSGLVINMGSLAGERGLEAPVHYAASKAAIRGFTETLAKAVARQGIRVICVAPGLLEGGVGHNVPDYKLADYVAHCALGRLGTFREVAEFMAFLASDHNSYMTGETILVDGGL
jgi:NAD(P)-dependent dehydrogenase (short-subunit alcohol dehydrogenase family)